jgi:hypothetical protein
MSKYFNSQALGWGMSRDFIKNRAVTGFFYSLFASKRLIPGEARYRKTASRMWLSEAGLG